MWRFLGILVSCTGLLAQAAPKPSPDLVPSPPEIAPPDSTLSTPFESPSTNIIITNTPYKIPENRILQFTVPITREAKVALAAKSQVVDVAKAAIAVPTNFDPEVPTPILLISGSSDGDGSSIRMMPAYTNVALRLGWIVIATDGPFGKPVLDNPAWRWALNSSLLDHIHKTWPRSRRWPVAVAGVSGGGKWSGVLGAVLANRGYNLVGVFMSGVNQDLASESAKLYEPALKYKSTPIYLSSGTDDKIATPQHHSEVRESLLAAGFTTVRLETFKGGHALSEAELRKALNWFIEEFAKK